MQRTLLALCAALLFAGLGMSATPAAAYVGDYDFSNRRSDSATVRTPSRAARNTRAARQRTFSQDFDSDTPVRATRRTARRGTSSASTASITGGSGLRLSGVASYYWQPQRVASGGWFNPNAMTAAHKTLPFGTRVRVTNLNNGRSTTVTINDRGPYIAGRIIDLSRAAAQAVGMTGSGIARVNVAVLGR